MANMEKIIRPHLPPNVAPTDTRALNRTTPENTVLQFGKNNTGTASTKTITADYLNQAKWYMTKQERELELGAGLRRGS